MVIATRLQTELDRARQRYLDATAGHELEVLLDAGVYRHLRYARPGTSVYLVDLITWPGHLAIGGDVDTLVFRRAHDMAVFMGGPISADYWAEKLVAPRGEDAVRAFSLETFRAYVVEHGLTVDDPHPLGQREAVETLIDAGVPDAWELDFRELSPQFLWACVAISDVLRRYREHTGRAS